MFFRAHDTTCEAFDALIILQSDVRLTLLSCYVR
jgi:hypothetical protein